MMRNRKVVSFLLCLSALSGTIVPSFVQKAYASTACTASRITINWNFGGEGTSTVWGHSHLYGNHYVHNIKPVPGNSKLYTWYWYADNNGGLDGDTADTFYDSVVCTNAFPP
jgi:hypothetical protein